MSILIKGMEMPKTGRYFVAVDNTDGKDKTVISVMSEFERGNKTRPLLAVCEVIPIPPHGDLKDADALIELCHRHNSQRTMWSEIEYLLDNAPTIIPAGEGE